MPPDDEEGGHVVGPAQESPRQLHKPEASNCGINGGARNLWYQMTRKVAMLWTRRMGPRAKFAGCASRRYQAAEGDVLASHYFWNAPLFALVPLFAPPEKCWARSHNY